jgi:hypothetical protein
MMLAEIQQLDLDGWLRGAVGGFISGGSAAIVGGITVTGLDPEHYSFVTRKFWILVGALFLVNGLVSMAKFLSITPLPNKKVVTRQLQTTTQGDAPPKVVETVREVHTEPAEPPATKG